MATENWQPGELTEIDKHLLFLDVLSLETKGYEVSWSVWG